MHQQNNKHKNIKGNAKITKPKNIILSGIYLNSSLFMIQLPKHLNKIISSFILISSLLKN